MIKIENHIGAIELSNEYLTSLIGHTATGCFGVVQMNPFGPKQGVRSLLNKEPMLDNGVIIRYSRGRDSIVIDLHITVSYGINVSAIVDSIINKVRYTVETEAGINVKKVNVFIDNMKA